MNRYEIELQEHIEKISGMTGINLGTPAVPRIVERALGSLITRKNLPSIMKNNVSAARDLPASYKQLESMPSGRGPRRGNSQY